MLIDAGPGGVLANAVALGAAAGAGALLLAEDEINAVITTLTDELDALNQNDFEVNAHVSAVSFGRGGPADGLAYHHARAHGVVVSTLSELISDLRTFRASVREARRLIGAADEESRAQLDALVDRTGVLDLGKDAHTRAQVDNVDTTPTTDPPGNGSADGSADGSGSGDGRGPDGAASDGSGDGGGA